LIGTADKSSINTVLDNLVFLSPTREFLYVTDLGMPAPEANNVRTPSRRFEHLSCFLPGLLALGAEQLTVQAGECTAEEQEKWMWAAEGLAHSCWLMYVDQVRCFHDAGRTKALAHVALTKAYGTWT
jgi:hypothetical protein